jgi:hypothetical protein
VAEPAWGAGQSARRFIYVTISTGLASVWSLTVNYIGAWGAHPEIGHHIIDPSDQPVIVSTRLLGKLQWAALQETFIIWMPDRFVRQQRMAKSGRCEPLRCLPGIWIWFCQPGDHVYPGRDCSWRRFDAQQDIILGYNLQTVHAIAVKFLTIKLAWYRGFGLDTGLAGAAQAWFHRFHEKPGFRGRWSSLITLFSVHRLVIQIIRIYGLLVLSLSTGLGKPPKVIYRHQRRFT